LRIVSASKSIADGFPWAAASIGVREPDDLRVAKSGQHQHIRGGERAEARFLRPRADHDEAAISLRERANDKADVLVRQ
jgi:hypothetical protein